MTTTPPTKWDYFGENENRIILSYNINRYARKLYFRFVKTQSLMRHSIEYNKQIL